MSFGSTGRLDAAAAGTWRLGDLEVNRMGFGAMRLPQTGRPLTPDAVPRDRDQAIAVLRRAVELGVNHIDTAAFYFSPLRSANELINAALNPYPDGLVIATELFNSAIETLFHGLDAESKARTRGCLDIAAGGAKGDTRILVAGHDRWTERCARSFPRRKRIDVPFNEPGHLSPSTKWKAQTGHDR